MNPVQHTKNNLVSFYQYGNVRKKYCFGFFFKAKIDVQLSSQKQDYKENSATYSADNSKLPTIYCNGTQFVDTAQQNKEGTNPGLKWFKFSKQFSLCE